MHFWAEEFSKNFCYKNFGRNLTEIVGSFFRNDRAGENLKTAILILTKIVYFK